MGTWTDEQLASLARAFDIRVAGRRDDGSPHTLVTVWHVVADGALYVRSYRGAAGQWYRGVLRHLEGSISWDGQVAEVRYSHDDPSHYAAVDAAYHAKYGSSEWTRMVTNAEAAATTLRVDPR